MRLYDRMDAEDGMVVTDLEAWFEHTDDTDEGEADFMAGGDYARIRYAFWTDPDIKRYLTIEQKALLLYYFSSPHSNMAGLYYCPLAYVAAETGLSVDDVREWTMGPLSRFVTYDEETEEVLVHRAAKHQIGPELSEKDKRLKPIRRLLDETHSARLVRQFMELYPDWPLEFDPGEEGASEAPSKPLAAHSSNRAVTEPPSGGRAHTREQARPDEVGGSTKRARQIPADWEPTEKHRELADRLGVDMAAEVEQFMDHHRARGSVMKDWDAAFRTWLRNARKFGPRRVDGDSGAREVALDERVWGLAS